MDALFCLQEQDECNAQLTMVVAFVFFFASSNIYYTCKGYLKMFDIPPGARHVLIQEDEASPHILGKCSCLLALL